MESHDQKHFPRPKQIVDNIISASDAIRYVLVVDENGEEVYSKTTPKSIIGSERSGALAKDIHFLKGLLKMYNDIIGENTFTHLIRSKGHVLMFDYANWIFLVSCERERSRHEIADISDKIEYIIKDHVK
jgi:hypothetical protein